MQCLHTNRPKRRKPRNGAKNGEPSLNFPNDTQHHSIIGANGSGKTQAAMWFLSRRNFLAKPWIIYDWKYEDLIAEVENTQEISVFDKIPDRPGLYVVHPEPDQTDAVDVQFRQIWQQENTGVYIDEGYMVGARSGAFRSLLSQGRSKHIPMIILSQRPAWMDRFVFTESQFFSVFRLQHRDDIKAIEQFVPNPDPEKQHPLEERLPEFWSYYYDVKANELAKMEPVPDRELIIQTFNSRLRRVKHVLA